MCLSATAGFSAGTALLGLGGLTLKSSTRRRELRREKCGYIARYAPEFFPFRALPARFGCTLAVKLNISQALSAVIYLHLVLQQAKRPLPAQKATS